MCGRVNVGGISRSQGRHFQMSGDDGGSGDGGVGGCVGFYFINIKAVNNL